MHKLSSLLKIMLQCLPAFEADARYKINCLVIHQPGEGICYLSPASILLPVEFKIPPTQYVSAAELKQPNYRHIEALFSATTGHIGEALTWLGYGEGVCEKCGLERVMYTTRYYQNPALFKMEMAVIASQLELRGL